jgi:glycosyltransferase involved in cell wall biosynthesis
MFTKNAMPFIREAVASLEAQTRDDYEVVIQDAVSTDGTVEFLSRLQSPRIHMLSEADHGLGDAYNRAFPRCRGDIVGTLDSDNLFLPDTLDRVDALFREHPTAVAIYGAVKMIDADGVTVGTFVPEEFDQRELMRCALVPPFSTTFFSRERCGSELRGDASLKTGQDFELLLRLSNRTIVRSTAVLGATRISYKSMTRNPENYDLFAAEKVAALDRFIADRPDLQPDRTAAITGIYSWAAESLLEIEGPGPRVDSFVERAAKLSPDDERVDRVRGRAYAAAAALAEREDHRLGQRLRSSAGRLLRWRRKPTVARR